ncbi:energy-coupling factor ABC transporter permease [Croceicoccus mobilis]|uniref:Cobalt transporter n=1 Tax=Croceicoccus mobilis TaxID=1703339 RepID=A0A916Z048_9SPHN|nr:energy-coupling factor ABC transporter permease [Croceicoccus mobilis]GGD69136.1 cobalt transporter [Croceicoccus mobilis]
MHIEPGVVVGAKAILGLVTAAAAVFKTGRAFRNDRHRDALATIAMRSLVATMIVIAIFQFLPHPPVGVSEVHLILGSTLLLTLGVAPAAIGLGVGLLLQGILFAPADLPQFGMNLTTLLLPLFAVDALAQRIVPIETAYVDLTYSQVLRLSATYQAGIVGWVAFWVLYGEGVSVGSLQSLASFAAVYASIIVIEPIIDLAVLAAARSGKGSLIETVFDAKVFAPS